MSEILGFFITSIAIVFLLFIFGVVLKMIGIMLKDTKGGCMKIFSVIILITAVFYLILSVVL